MPYFIYKIYPPKRLELVESFAKYREAKDTARKMRAALADASEYTVKMIHAKHENEAERLLLQERKPRPLGEDA